MKRRGVVWVLIALAALAGAAAESRDALAQTPAPSIVGGPFVESLPSHDSDGDGVNDTYGQTDMIKVAYHLSEAVCGGDSALTLAFQTVGSPPEFRRAEYAGCAGAYGDVPAKIRFEYAVTAGDMDGDGFGVAANSLYLKPYEGDGMNIANPAFSAGPPHKIDGGLDDAAPPRLDGAPGVANYPRNGSAFLEGESIEVRMVFTEDVIVDNAGGNPTVELRLGKQENPGAEIVKAEYAKLGDEPSRHMVFSYAVQSGDENDDGIIWARAGSLVVPPGSSIRDAAGNDARVDWTASGGAEFGVSGTPTPTPPCDAWFLDEFLDASCDYARGLEVALAVTLIMMIIGGVIALVRLWVT